jgi:hypothetical protein
MRLSELPDLPSEQERLLRLHNQNDRHREMTFRNPHNGMDALGEIERFDRNSVTFSWIAHKVPGTNKWRIHRQNATLFIPLGRSMGIGGGHGGSWYNLLYAEQMVSFWINDQTCNARKVNPDDIEGLDQYPEAYRRQKERFETEPEYCTCIN